MYTAAHVDTRYPPTHLEQLKFMKNKDQRIAHLTSEFMMITPEIAAQMLEGNSINRPIDKNRIATYVSEMKKGNWKINGETIIFNSKGALANGQHRLLSIIKSGVSVMILVVNGVDEDAMRTMDTGKSRSTADILSLEHFDKGYGKHCISSVSTAIGILIKYKAGVGISTSGGNRLLVTALETDKFFVQHEALLVGFDREIRGLAKSNSRIAEIGEGIATWFILHEIDSDLAREFIYAVYTGIGLKPETPQYHLRNIMIAQRKTGSGKRKGFRPRDFVYLSIKAWNSIRSGRGIKYENNLRIALDEERSLIVAK